MSTNNQVTQLAPIDLQPLRTTIEKAKEQDYQKVVMRVTLAERLLDELEAKDKWIAELSVSHSKLHEGMAAIYNAICADGASTSLSAILTFVKRAFEESKAAVGITVKGE